MLRNFMPGQELEVSFNVSSREFNGKYYHNIDAWKITAASVTNQANYQANSVPAIESAPLPTEEDDLPF